MKLLITDIFGCCHKAKARNDVMNYFEKFLPHSIIIPSFMTIRSQMPELDWGGGAYKIGSQNTPFSVIRLFEDAHF